MSVMCSTASILAGFKTVCTKFGPLSTVLKRHASESAVMDVPEEKISKSVFISQSNDIFTNLALEDWIYRHFDLTKHHILLIWKNDPCVVVGRHQNPWAECNVPAIKRNHVALARRNSGGGTVYHDNGNLNLSFFTPRERYDRKYNLGIITRALFREYGMKSTVNKKEDIMMDGYKVSGTAAKLGRLNAYHHCTLLVDSNTNALSVALKKVETGIISTATESVRSPVMNLKQFNLHVNCDTLIGAIGWEFMRTKAFTLIDGGDKLIQQQYGFKLINPSEGWYPGIDKYKEEFQSWEWNYGKSPKFTVTRMLEDPNTSNCNQKMKLSVEVEKGIIRDIKMTLPTDPTRDADVVSNLQGLRYSHDLVDSIVEATGCKVVDSKVTAESNIAAI